MTNHTDAALELEEIHEEMMDLLRRAGRIVREADGDGSNQIHDRASSYWMAHVKSALGDESYPTHACTMADTIQEIREAGDPACPICGEPVEPDHAANFHGEPAHEDCVEYTSPEDLGDAREMMEHGR